MDKDEDEEELDRLVLGDGAGFMSQLGEEAVDMDGESSEGDMEAELGFNEERGLEDVDDAEVRSAKEAYSANG